MGGPKVDVLLSHGADPNLGAEAARLKVPLLAAVLEGNAPAVRALIAAGANCRVVVGLIPQP
jgi:ankyrin repeat protein